jgi:hypothetical protein
MQSQKVFVETVSKSFLKHLYNNSYVPWKSFPLTETKRSKFLTQLYSKVTQGLYTPSFPRDYVVSNKHNYVARIVPSLTLEDYCVYYYCVKTIEKFLAINRVEGTYGGYRLGGEFRKKENIEFNELQEITFSVSPFTFNHLAWVKAWRDFQKKARVYSADKNFKYFLKFDIANFYNTINLTILERKIRVACPKEYTDEIDLLFHFLKFWNKRFLKYSEQTISIPQDEVGDCSRLLANFYLQEYDQQLFSACNSAGCKFMRYADDQILLTTDKEKAEDILFFASKELFKIGLNINSAKVDRYNRDDWEYYWSFSIFDLLGDPNNVNKIEIAVDAVLALDKGRCRFDSLLRRILNCRVDKIPFNKRLRFLPLVTVDDFLLNCDSRLFVEVYKLLSRGEKQNYIKKLRELAGKARYNSFHYNLLRAYHQGMPIGTTREIYQKISELKL